MSLIFTDLTNSVIGSLFDISLLSNFETIVILILFNIFSLFFIAFIFSFLYKICCRLFR